MVYMENSVNRERKREHARTEEYFISYIPYICPNVFTKSIIYGLGCIMIEWWGVIEGMLLIKDIK